MKPLTPEEEEAYARQIVLRDIGYEGQVRIKNGRVLLLGVGALGGMAATLLAAMGLGFLRIVDRSPVLERDALRQILYRKEDIGRPKVEAAEERLMEINPMMEVEAIPASVSPDNISKLVDGMDVVLDGLDNMPTRYIVNRGVVKRGMPYVFASAAGKLGNVSTIIPGRTPCLECFYGGIYNTGRYEEGFPPAVNIVASISVSEGLRIIMGQEPKLAGKLLYIDLKNLSFDMISLKRGEDCPVCGMGQPAQEARLERVEVRKDDGHVSIFVNEYNEDFKLEIAMRRLEALGGTIEGKYGKGFKFSINGYEGYLFSSGTMVIRGRDMPGLKRWVEELYEKVVGR